MRSPGGTFGPAACRSRRSLPGCELITQPAVIAAATDGNRLVVLMAGDHPSEAAAWDLLVSDDLGATVRRFSLDGVTGNGRDGGLHLFQGRIFVLASLTDPVVNSVGSARVFEVDPFGGAITLRGAPVAMTGVTGHAAASGVLTTVDFAFAPAPQKIDVTRFDPATNVIRRDEIACDDAACGASGQQFVSGDGETFDVLTRPAGATPAGQRCLATVKVSSLTVATECPSAPPVGEVIPISSFGGTPYDYQLALSEGSAAWSLVPTTRHWIPSGPPSSLGIDKVFWRGGSFFAFSPPELALEGDDFLLRLDAGGKMKKTSLQHEGCLTVGPRPPPPGCAGVVTLLPLPGDAVLFVTQRDEFQDDTRSRILFEVARSSTAFEAFDLAALSQSP